MFERFQACTPCHDCLVDITAGMTINENADPTVQADVLEALERVVPWRGHCPHAEGNPAAHVKASLMGSSCCVPVPGRYLAGFDGPRTRQVWQAEPVIAG